MYKLRLSPHNSLPTLTRDREAWLFNVVHAILCKGVCTVLSGHYIAHFRHSLYFIVLFHFKMNFP